MGFRFEAQFCVFHKLLIKCDWDLMHAEGTNFRFLLSGRLIFIINQRDLEIFLKD